jgi:hypothetical protein
MIRFADGVEFQRLCEHYLGHRGEFVQDFQVATAPDVIDRMCIYHVPDDTALATWIHLKHPEWIDYVWANRNRSAQVLDPEDTFLQLVAEDMHERARNKPLP